MSYRHAIVNKENKVINVILYDGVSPWKCPDDHTLIRSDHCDIDDTYDHENQLFIKKGAIDDDGVQTYIKRSVVDVAK